MAGGSIAGISFITLKGRPQGLALRVADVSRPGVDGHAYQIDAQRGRPFEMLGWKDYLNQAAADAGRVALLALQGTLVTLIDDFQKSFDNVMVLEVEEINLAPVTKSVGGLIANSTRLSITRFLLQKAQ